MAIAFIRVKSNRTRLKRKKPDEKQQSYSFENLKRPAVLTKWTHADCS